jgi:hypothetical protein
MWGDSTTFGWPVLDDGRFIVHRADYSATSDVTFAENAGMPPRVVAELRKRINDMGIAGTRFFVFGHSMGALLFKIYMGGAGAPYARPDNFFAGDVYALVSIDAPFLGSYLAPFMRFLASLPTIGPQFTASMDILKLHVDRGCMESLDPAGPDIASIPVALGAFHSFVGWGGREMRAAGIQFADDRHLQSIGNVIELLGYSFDNVLLRCGPGDDFAVCTDSQQGGLSSAFIDNFHYVDVQAKAIHFDSISEERAPSMAAEQLLNTPTANSSVWSYVLPAAAPMRLAPVGEARDVLRDEPAPAFSAGDGISLSLAKQSDGIALNWTGAASRLWTSLTPTLAGGVCLAVSGGGAMDPHALTVPTNTYYEVGSGSLCTAGDTLSIGSISPASGATSGGYRITLLGTAFGPGTKVRIGELYADSVVAVNSTTLTFHMMPGTPGETPITVIDEAGHTANAVFTYTDPGPIPGIVQITAPADGAVVTAGSTITVSASGFGGFVIAGALVTSAMFSATDDRDPGDPFVTTATIPAAAIGPIAIGLLARDASGNVKSATPVTITAVVPGNVALRRLDAEKLTLLYASPIRQLRVYGCYSDGIRREITHEPGIVYEMDTQDPRKPNYPYNGTGVAVVDAGGLVAAKTHGTTLCHVSYSGLRLDVVVEVAEILPMLTILKPGFISWPYQGAGVTYDVVRGKLSGLRATGGNYAEPSLGTVCVKDNFANVTAADSTNPPGGDGYFYLMRDSRTLSYEEQPLWATRSQIGQRTGELNAAPTRCP